MIATEPETAEPAPPLWTFAVAVGLAALVLHLLYMWPGGPCTAGPGPTYLRQDEGTVLYDSARIAAGEVMYRDFFEFQGPVFYHLFGGLFTLSGPSLVAARGLQVLVWAQTAGLLALLVARHAGRLAGAGAAALHATVLVGFYPFCYPHWLAEALALGGLVCLGAGRGATAGVLLALAAATIQSLGAPLLVAALVAPERRRIVLGAAATLAVVVAVAAARGALGAMFEDVVRWPSAHYAAGQTDATTYAYYLRETVDAQGGASGALWAAGAWLTAGLPFAALAGLLAVGRPGARALGLGAVAATLPLLLAVTRRDITHIAFVGSFGLLGLGVAAGATRVTRRAAGAILGAVGALALAAYGERAASTWQASRALSFEEQVISVPGAARARALPDGEYAVAGAGAGWLYLMVRRPPPGLHYTFIPQGMPGYFSDAQWRELADDVVRRPPSLLILGPDQWTELTTRRPELAERCAEDQDGLYVCHTP